MTALADVRNQVKDHLIAANIRAFVVKPETFVSPVAFVAPGDPYITREGATFRGEIVHLQITLVVDSGTNDRRAEELDDLLLRALDVLYALDDYVVGDVLQPGQVAINGQAHLAVAINISIEIHR